MFQDNVDFKRRKTLKKKSPISCETYLYKKKKNK